MKILESKIFDIVNLIITFIQNKADIIRNNSFFLLNIDYFILTAILLTYTVSVFANTELIGVVSVFVPILVTLKVLITKGEKIELEKCNLYLLIYLFICLISNFTSSMPHQSFYGFMKTIIYFGFYFALCQFLKNNKKYITIILFAVSVLIGIESIIAIMQSTIGIESISTWQDTSYVNPEDVISRVYGTLKPYNPNLFAGWLVAGISSIIGICALFFRKRKFKTAIVSLIILFLSMLTIFDTGSRGAYLALFIILIGIVLASFQMVFYDFTNEKLKKIWKLFLGFGSILSILFMTFNHGIFHRLMSIFILRADSSTSFRINVYNSALNMFRDNPIFGIGVGNKVFREIYGLYMLSGYDALSCYCIFLEMAVESGIFSLIAYLAFIFTLLVSAVRIFINSKDFDLKILLFVSFISISAVMVHGIFDTIYFRPQVQYIFWTMSAILTVLVRDNKLAK